jgi:hypothetical protein
VRTSSSTPILRAACVLLVGAIALAASLGPLMTSPERVRGGLGRFGDTPLYLTLAYNLDAGHGFSGTSDGGAFGEPVVPPPAYGPAIARSPVYPFVIQWVYRAFGSPRASRSADTWPLDWHRVRIVQCVLHALTALLVVALVRALWPAAFWPAIAAGLLQAVGVYSLYYTRELLSETVTTLLVTLAVLLTVRALAARRLHHWVLAGAALGLVVLARPEYAAAPVLLAAYAAWVRRARGWTMLREVAALVLVAACVVAPWTLRNLRVSGHAILVAEGGMGSNLYTGSYETPRTWRGWGAFPESIFFLPDEPGRLATVYTEQLRAMREGGLDVIRADSSFRALALERIRARPLAALGVWITKIPRLWYQDYIPMYGVPEASGLWFVFYLAFALVSFALAPVGRRASMGVVALLFGYLNLVFFPVHVEPRYGVALMPAVIALTGIGLGLTADRLRRRPVDRGPVVDPLTPSPLALTLVAVLLLAPVASARAAVLDSVTTTTIAEVPAGLAFEVYQQPRPWSAASTVTGTHVHVPEDPAYPGLFGHDLFVAPSGLAVADIASRGSERTLSIDGVARSAYRHIAAFSFSELGSHFAFAEVSAETGIATLVIDDAEFPLEPRQQIVSGPHLSPDGGRWACVLRERDDVFVRTAERLAGPYQDVRSVTFSRDGRRMGVVAKVRGFWTVIVDDREVSSGDDAGPVVFDRSGRHVAASIKGGSMWHVMRDETVGDGHLGIAAGSLVFSRDGARLGFAAGSSAEGRYVVVDGTPSPLWSDVSVDSSLFSPDGRHTACWVSSRGSWRLLVDDTVATSDVSRPGLVTFSEDGRHLAFTEWVGRNGPWRVVCDGVPGPLFDEVGIPRLIGAGPRLVYTARTGNCQRVVVDGVPGPCFEQVGVPAATPDGRHVAYVAAEPGPRAWAIVDGQRGPTFEAILSACPAFGPDGGLQYFAVSRSELLLVRHTARPATR